MDQQVIESQQAQSDTALIASNLGKGDSPVIATKVDYPNLTEQQLILLNVRIKPEYLNVSSTILAEVTGISQSTVKYNLANPLWQRAFNELYDKFFKSQSWRFKELVKDFAHLPQNVQDRKLALQLTGDIGSDRGITVNIDTVNLGSNAVNSALEAARAEVKNELEAEYEILEETPADET